uniref:Uncharacterized protein n=1 Tax=Asparagus officinalis TaxID=4686 RepID=Q2AA84_ASPOF|nr:hypothetical protein 17.t00007 [Asparagus officinalis]
MQRVRELHDQQLQALSNQQAKSSRYIQNVAVDSYLEVNEVIIADAPPQNTRTGPIAPLNNTGDDDEIMKELETKVNSPLSLRGRKALVNSQEF